MIILASNSPRRKELLEQIHVKFKIVVADVDEVTENLSPENLVKENALRKSLCVSKQEKNFVVLGADTVVSLQGKIFGKPKNLDDAKQMLKILSGKWHDVFTGVAFSLNEKILAVDVCQTKVKFDEMTDEEIFDYVKTNEPMNKAGSYAIQGIAAQFIEKIDGDFSNVVGLPLHLVKKIAKEKNINLQ